MSNANSFCNFHSNKSKSHHSKYVYFIQCAVNFSISRKIQVACQRRSGIERLVDLTMSSYSRLYVLILKWGSSVFASWTEMLERNTRFQKRRLWYHNVKAWLREQNSTDVPKINPNVRSLQALQIVARVIFSSWKRHSVAYRVNASEQLKRKKNVVLCANNDLVSTVYIH